MSAVSCHWRRRQITRWCRKSKRGRRQFLFTHGMWLLNYIVTEGDTQGRRQSPITIMCCNNNKQSNVLVKCISSTISGDTCACCPIPIKDIIPYNFRELAFRHLISIKHGWKNYEHLTCQNRFSFVSCALTFRSTLPTSILISCWVIFPLRNRARN